MTHNQEIAKTAILLLTGALAIAHFILILIKALDVALLKDKPCKSAQLREERKMLISYIAMWLTQLIIVFFICQL